MKNAVAAKSGKTGANEFWLDERGAPVFLRQPLYIVL